MSSQMQKKKRIVRILRIIMPIVGIISAIVIPPLDLVPPMIAPLPDTVQEQVDDAIDLWAGWHHRLCRSGRKGRQHFMLLAGKTN